MDRLTTADFNEAVRIRNRPPPGCSKSVTREQKICARLRRLQKNPGELQKSHKNGFRSAQLPGGARGCACQAPKLVDFRLLLLRLKAVLNTLVESAARLCDAFDAVIFLREGESLVFGATDRSRWTWSNGRSREPGLPGARSWIAARSMCTTSRPRAPSSQKGTLLRPARDSGPSYPSLSCVRARPSAPFRSAVPRCIPSTPSRSSWPKPSLIRR